MNFTNDIPPTIEKLEIWKANKLSTLPEATRAAIAKLAMYGPVQTIVETAETLYAARSLLDREGLEVAAQLFHTAGYNGWWGLGQPDINGGPSRAARIITSIRRDLGETNEFGAWPTADTDPSVNTQYDTLPKPEEEKPEEPVAPPAPPTTPPPPVVLADEPAPAPDPAPEPEPAPTTSKKTAAKDTATETGE